MSLKRNVTFNYASQLYIIGISIVTLPKLLEVVGAEAYGIVGFFSMMQAWLAILDLGMSPTLAREISRYRGGATSANLLLLLFAKLRKYFLALGLLFLVLFVTASFTISNYWFKAAFLSSEVIQLSLILIAFIVVIRWFSGFYKALVNGYEALQWLSSFNALINTLRFVVVFIPLYFSNSIIVFFTYQLLVVCIEWVCLSIKVKRLLPKGDEQPLNEVDANVYLKTALKFSLSLAFTSAVWVLVTQMDKLLLSKLLTLSEFGYFTIAVQLAGGITLVSGPISSAIIPRMSTLEAEGKQQALIEVYRNATQLIVTGVGSIALVLTFFSRFVIYAWSGNAVLVQQASPYLVLYSIGNFLLALSAFPYYLQYAKGNLRFHIWGNIGFVCLLIPAIIYFVTNFGGIGAGYVWLIMNCLYFLIWVPIIHHSFNKQLNAQWYGKDIVLSVVSMIAVAYVCSLGPISETNRISILLYLSGVALALIVTGGLFSSYIRETIIRMFKEEK
ncbi:MAG: oligosaccharide flippase family protein [Bacteroidia bacterium]|jgi:O-antigen/teichoic acid export membrane protein|nr:oligosaccharide flippase family protein [Bacteroidia bacterium]